MTYIFIFFAKTLENALCTFRLIVVSNGKKLLGALLNAVISFIWVITTGMVVMKGFHIKKIVAFLAGCFLGSYLGSYFEEKMALGNNLLLCITSDQKRNLLEQKLQFSGFKCTYTRAGSKENIQNILFIFVPRKKIKNVLKIIHQVDETAIVFSESASKIYKKDTL